MPRSAKAEAARIALLIGNSDYSGEAALPNAASDASLMESVFADLGFKTYFVQDLIARTGSDPLQALEEAAIRADIAVIYYTGHGMAADGQNCLIPVVGAVGSEQDVRDTAVPISRLLSILAKASYFGMVLFNACRTNPWSQQIERDSGLRGI
ncbi:caspase family protein [Pseudooctadecabacter jejudonensis]|uniref:Caspase domain protein n=1 Tax=Pseudooctadecabacter jejudonensis TaxID=1391910 RepID=A0A1Y5TIK0_9RHOB|nr:caspase family protein [Pseudooctadecabacter jejudonensis]SLN62784.1 Caspase domain protein [Pseudooctadecabacter jejudonensis]